jgi:predicted amidohydrolase YtcJ
MFADLVLKNGKIVTIDEKGSIAEAVAVKFGRILAVGTNDEIKGYVGETTEVVDLKGRTVTPGLIDSHCHQTASGARKYVTVELSQESGIHSIADIQKRLAERVKVTPKGEWIYGGDEDDSKLAEKRHPTRWELDEATPDHPVTVTTRGGHFCIANSKAFEVANVSKDTPDPAGGTFERDPATGELTGGVHEKATQIITPVRPTPNKEQAYAGAKDQLLACAAAGLTCVHDSIGESQIRAINDLKNNGELPIRVRIDVHKEHWPELKKVGIYQGFGDDWVRITAIKFFWDGAISARTAAVTEPYLHRPDFYGVLGTTPELAMEELEAAYKEGYRIVTHANGDAAVALFCDVMEVLQKKYPRKDPRNRDIHCTVVNPELIARLKKLDILPTIFGPYVYYHGDKLLPAFGEERLEWMFAARSFLDAGMKVSAHSDYGAGPMPPLMAIHGLVNRVTKAGRPIGQSQRISVMEALKLYTINAAYHSFDEDKQGSIEVGKLADFTVYGEDILTVPTDTIIDIPIDMTIIDGKTVYARENA